MLSTVLAARQIDRKLMPLKRLTSLHPPRSGWLKAIREALHMSQADLARRLKVTQPSVDSLERSESAKTISLRTLQRAAEALDCQLVYALVPRQRLETSIKTRARILAERMARTTERTMRLEMQGIPTSATQRMIADISRALAAKPPRRFWAD